MHGSIVNESKNKNLIQNVLPQMPYMMIIPIFFFKENYNISQYICQIMFVQM